MFFARGEETVEGQCVFAYVGVDQERHFGAEIGESSKRGKRHGNQVADSADVENNLIGSFFEQAAAEESDHRMKVLPLRRDGVNAGRGGGLIRRMRPGLETRRRRPGGCVPWQATEGISHRSS